MVTLDVRVLAVSSLTVMACGVAFASAPAWLASRVELYAATRTGSGNVIGGHRRTRSLLAANSAQPTARLRSQRPMPV